MHQKKRFRLGLPLLLGALTFALILLALWPQEPDTVTVLVAARDLGAGSVLTAADLSPVTLEASTAPADALADPATLVGQTLAVVRFQGEPVTPRHLGPAVAVQPDERAVSLQVRQDQGLAGILRPGMKVGVVATLEDPDGNIQAKAMLEDLRVVYVSPDFQARPDLPITAQMTVQNGTSTTSGGTGITSSRSGGNTGATAAARDGIVIVAAPIAPKPIYYTPITETVPLTYTLLSQTGTTGGLVAAGPMTATQLVTATAGPKAGAAGMNATAPQLAVWHEPVGAPDMLHARSTWVSPVELLAALNAQNQAFTLVLMPEDAEPYVSPGLDLADFLPPARDQEVKP